MSDEASERLGQSIRELMDASVLFDQDAAGPDADATIEEIAASIDALRDQLAKHRRATMAWPDHASMQRGLRVFSPMIGVANPLAPPLTVIVDPEGIEIGSRAVIGTATMRAIHEGPPNGVHGGWVASLLDQLLGHANAMSGVGGMTIELTVRYLRRTPYDVPLTLRARTVSVDDRRVTATGEIVADGIVTAEATGLFLQPSQQRRDQMRDLIAGR